jgi:hypothetical protein
MAESNALAVLPDGDGIPSGDLVEVMLTDPDRVGTAMATGGCSLR